MICEVGVIILILQDGETGVQCYKSDWAQECVEGSWGKAAWRAEKAGYSRPGVCVPNHCMTLGRFLPFSGSPVTSLDK